MGTIHNVKRNKTVPVFIVYLPNHEITCCVFLHWLEFSFCLKLELILSKITLLSFPDLLFPGLINRRILGCSRSILSPIPNLLEISFNSESISSIKSYDPCLYVFMMLSCKSSLYVFSDVSYIFLVLFAKMKILGEELIFFKSLAKYVWNWSLESRKNYITLYLYGIEY
jgi:hypothetical protein